MHVSIFSVLSYRIGADRDAPCLHSPACALARSAENEMCIFISRAARESICWKNVCVQRAWKPMNTSLGFEESINFSDPLGKTSPALGKKKSEKVYTFPFVCVSHNNRFLRPRAKKTLRVGFV